MPSAAYQLLETRINELEMNLLPRVPPTHVVLTPAEIDLTSSFIVLAVAEIENYIEDCCSAVAKRAEQEWKKNGRLTKAATSLIMAKSFKDDFANPREGICSGVFSIRAIPPRIKSSAKDVHSALDSAVKSFRSKVDSNHGTKDHNVRKLLFALGVFENQLDATLLINLTSIAETRGLAAHKSMSTAARSIPHPVVVKNNVSTVIVGLKKMDAILDKWA